MKKLIILVLILSTLFAKEIILKHRIFVNNSQNLQYTIDHISENSLIDVNITYFDKNLIIRNKKNLEINFINNVDYGRFFIENSKNIKISGVNKGFYDVGIDINNSKNIILDNFYILSYLFKLNINNSKVEMLNINYSNKTDYNKEFLNFKSSYFNNYYINISDNSIFYIANSNLKGYKIFYINNSFFKINNVSLFDIYPDYNSVIKIDNSNFVIKNSSLLNENSYSDRNSSLIQTTNSNGIIENSQFKNIQKSISNINSNLEIKNNEFINNKISIVFKDEAKGKIIDNVLRNEDDNIGDGINDNDDISSEGIYLIKNSQASIYNNEFSNIKFGIRLNNSKADIKENKFSNILYSIELFNNSSANIINNITTFSKYPNVYFVDETSTMFERNNKGEFYIKNNNAYLSFFINLDILEIKIDESKFKFEHFKFLKNVKSFSIKTFKKRSLIKGVLKENLVISLPNGDEDEIEKGTHLVIKTENNGAKKSYFIVKPKEYKGCKLDKIPNLKREYNFKLSTFSKKIGNKIRFYFQIKSDKLIKSIYFRNDHPLTLINNIDYKTKPRRKIFDNKNNVLIIKFNDDSIKTFNCLIDNNETLQCNPIKKINF